MGKGVTVLAKLLQLLFLLMIPLFWEHGVAPLLATIIVASVCSHMPSRFRRYSFLPPRRAELVDPSDWTLSNGGGAMTQTRRRDESEGSRRSRAGLRRLAPFLIGAGVWGAAVVSGGPAAADPGDPDKGRAVFADKQCARCHLPRGASGPGPALEDLRRPQGEMELAGRLWNHVPGMLAALAEGGSQWPQIGVGEMADLMVYLRADPARDPAPDFFKGHLLLLRKGCLKCHSLGREGGRVEPDLAEPRADYESAAAWAAAMWAHTPGMAAMASQKGIPYPRFSGDEMGNLVGFLKHAAGITPQRRTQAAPSQGARAPGDQGGRR